MIFITGDEEIQRIANEMSAELVLVTFVVRNDKEVGSMIVPINSFNHEVSKPCFKIPNMVTTDGIEVVISLPDVDLLWSNAAEHMEKYLYSQIKKNRKKVTMSPVLSTPINSNIFVPFYYIAKELHFDKLIGILDQGFNTATNSQALQILNDLCKNDYISASLQNIFDKVWGMLSQSLNSIPRQTLQGIRHAKTILKFIEASPIFEEPACIIGWLESVFEEFKKDSTYYDEIEEIINNLRPSKSNAFIIWLYSRVLPEIDGKNAFLQFSKDFVLTNYYPLLSLEVKDIKWFIQAIDKRRNQKAISDMICQWLLIETNSPKDQFDLYRFALENKLFWVNNLSGTDITTLLPFAEEDNNVSFLKQLIFEIKSSIEKWRNAICKWNPNMKRNSFHTMLAAFDLRENPKIPNITVRREIGEMKVSYLELDTIFFNWIKSHPEINSDIFNYYITSCFGSKIINRKPYRILKILDYAYRIDPMKFQELKVTWMDRNKLDWKEILEHYLLKKTGFCNIVYEEVHQHIYEDEYLMTLFCKILIFSGINNVELMIPFNEQTIHYLLEIKPDFDFSNKTFTQYFTAITMNTLSDDEIKSAIMMYKVHNFNQFIEYINDESKIFRINQMIRNEIYDKSHIPLSDVLSVYETTPKIQLEFVDNNMSEKVKNEKYILEWGNMTPPKTCTQNTLALLPPKCAVIYVFSDRDNKIVDEILSSMTFIGVNRGIGSVAIFFVDSMEQFTPLPMDTVVIWQPVWYNNVKNVNNVKMLINAFRNPVFNPLSLIINAKAFGTIMRFAFEEWKCFFPVVPSFNFAEQKYAPIKMWCEPSIGLLPKKEDLLSSSMIDIDRFFHRIPMRFSERENLKEYSHILQTTDGTIFCAAMAKLPLAIFNFDLVYPMDDNNQLINIIRKKQCAECILSLMSITRTNCPPIIH